jgi:hypothetical protein
MWGVYEMNFMDEDLHRLKENIRNNRIEGNSMADSMFLDQAEALIARMEAAEYALSHAPKADYYDDVYVDAVKRWCKAKGK